MPFEAAVSIGEGRTDYEVRRSSTQPGMFEVALRGGGRIPNELSGSYTRVNIAEAAIKRYLQHRRKR